MSLIRPAALVALSFLASCAPPQAPGLCLGRVRQVGDRLVVTAAPNRYWRGAYLYVLAAEPPAAGGQARPRIGLIQITEPASGDAAWYCRPTQALPAELAAPNGLPVEEYAPDSRLRVGKCWGHVLPPKAEELKEQEGKSVLTLRIDLGEGDRVQAEKDQFEILGDPDLDWDSHTVLGFQRIGVCTALPFSNGGPLTSTCLLDAAEWPKFTLDQWKRGRAVHLHQKDR